MNKSARKALSLLVTMGMMTSYASCATTTTETVVDTVVETEDVETSATAEVTTAATTQPTENEIPSVNPEFLSMSPEEICATLSLEQKAAQMVQGAIYNISYRDVENNGYGSVLSTNSTWPNNTPEVWTNIINHYQRSALSSESGIPFVYGQDSVHGVNYAGGGVIFPHNINIGATRDTERAYEMGRIVGSDVMNTRMIWNFAPCVAAAQDPRWGRTYESYSSDPEIINQLATPFTRGMIEEGVIVCPKHFLCEGYTVYGTGEVSGGVNRLIDRGDAIITDEVIEANLAIYQSLINEGAQTIMISHSALNGTKMHEYGEYIMMLKNEMGFEGFIISDWDSIENCSGADLEENVILCVNAGIDMLMEADNYEECRQIIVDAVNSGAISQERVDDAVTRIIRVKMDAGLFEDPYLENIEPSCDWNSDDAQELARTLASESLVPLKDDAGLTIEPGSRVFVTGPAMDDTGVMCGGWTYTWEGNTDSNVGMQWVATGSTIFDALRHKAEEYDLTIVTDEAEIDTCDVVILCVGEIPYAEWNGDTADLSITGSHGLDGNAEAIALAQESGLPTITLVVAGRNVIISDYIDQWDSVIMCYLPGSEGGNAIAANLLGEAEYTGTLPMPYYESVEDIESGRVWHDVGYSA